MSTQCAVTKETVNVAFSVVRPRLSTEQCAPTLSLLLNLEGNGLRVCP